MAIGYQAQYQNFSLRPNGLSHELPALVITPPVLVPMVVARSSEARVIEVVEKLSLEFQIHSVVGVSLYDRYIPLLHARPD